MKTKNISFIVLVIFVASTLQYCGTAKNSTKKKKNLISYAERISPIMENSCAPCHYPETGKKKLLDTYEATKENIVSILDRVEREKNARGFMPRGSKNPHFTPDQIQLLKDWMSEGMAE